MEGGCRKCSIRADIGRTAFGIDAPSGPAQYISRLQPGTRIQIRPAIRAESNKKNISSRDRPNLTASRLLNFRRPSPYTFDRCRGSPSLWRSAGPDNNPGWPLTMDKYHQRWKFLPETPSSDSAGEHGLSKNVDFQYPQREGITNRFTGFCRFREDHLQNILGQGWNVFYDHDGDIYELSGP